MCGQKGNLPESAFKPVLRVGTTVPNFISFTTEREKLELSGLYGKHKIILIDFWASWCIPCRAEISNIKRVYDSFAVRGFTVLSVSEDFLETDWNKAIKKDSMVWYNVSSLQGREEPLAKAFRINALPAAILIDNVGQILAIDAPGAGIPSGGGSLRGASLYQKVKELLSN